MRAGILDENRARQRYQRLGSCCRYDRNVSLSHLNGLRGQPKIISIALLSTEGMIMAITSLAQVRPHQALLHSPIPAIRRLRAEESELEVVLTGSVASYYLKQLAQVTVMIVPGVKVVQNELQVEGGNR